MIAEQLRLQRIQQRAQEQQEQAAQLGVSEVNPEFLAALPPTIQEEVRPVTLQCHSMHNSVESTCICTCVFILF